MCHFYLIILNVAASLHLLKNLIFELHSFAGFSTVCQALARAAPATSRLRKQRRCGDPFYGGGHCGDGAVMDEPYNSKGRSFNFDVGIHRI